MEKELTFAVLIDGDNAQPSLLESILKEIRSGNSDANRPIGKLALKRIYGDWTTNNMNGWKDDLHRFGIRPVQQFRYDNNATDGALMMDAIEIIHQNPRINAFCIVSSDSDFYNLALRIRENGLYVLGIGNRQTKDVFQKACNDFVFTNNLPSVSPVSLRKTAQHNNDNTGQSQVDSVETLLKDTFESITTFQSEWVKLAKFGEAIKNEDPGFDPRSFGHRNLSSLIQSYSIFEIQSDDATPPNLSIRLLTPQKANNNKLEGLVKKFIQHYGFIEHKTGDYYFHISNIEKTCRDIPMKRGLKVRFNVFKQPNPDHELTDERNGKASEIEILID